MISLFHISDLHIGDHPQWSSLNPVRRLIPRLRGHDEFAAESLAREWEHILGNFPNTVVAVTGDVTYKGHSYDFGCFHRFVHSYWSDPLQLPSEIGLNAGGDRTFIVPGNHDFWTGGTFLGLYGVNRGILGAHFNPLPWVVELLDQTDMGIEMHLVGLDSCSGLPRMSWNQTIAVGSIDPDQLDTARILLEAKSLEAQERGNTVVRVVLIHHPIENLESSSQKEFGDWLDFNQIYAVLTGHTHTPNVPPPTKTRPPYQLVCGTTLQTRRTNCFYLHSIQQVDTDFVWETREWQRYGKYQNWLPIGGRRVWHRGI